MMRDIKCYFKNYLGFIKVKSEQFQDTGLVVVEIFPFFCFLNRKKEYIVVQNADCNF